MMKSCQDNAETVPNQILGSRILVQYHDHRTPHMVQ